MNTTIENFIGIFENAYSKEYCDSVIKYFEDMSQAGLTLNRQQQNSTVRKTAKDDTQFYGTDEISIVQTKFYLDTFNDVFWNKAYPAYTEVFDSLKDAEPHSNYAFKIQRTDVGGGYHMWHFESDGKAACRRLLVWSLYLNDVDEGGETEFLYYSKRIKAKTGTLVIWPAGFTHVHRGNPPLSNTKYIITGWVEF
jgi:hypothetical protein